MENYRFFLFLAVSVTLLGQVYPQPTFTYPNSPSTTAPGLSVDSTGRVFVSAGNRLFRLSPDLVEEQSISLSADVVDRGIALSGDGSKVVVCLTDLSCSVYNATDLTAGPVRTDNNTIASVDFGVALVTAGDTFYVGSISGEGPGNTILIEQHGEGFVRSSNSNPSSNSFVVSPNQFSRSFYGGFEKNGNTYIFAVDNNPFDLRRIKIMRVCHVTNCPGGASTCGITALYEADITNCGGTRRISTRICSVSVVEDFDGRSGTTILFSRCDSDSSRNSVCYVDLDAVDMAMNSKFNSCSTAAPSSNEELDIVWGADKFCGIDFQVKCIHLIFFLLQYVFR